MIQYLRKICFSAPLDGNYEAYYLSEMKKAGYEMIALTQNLDHVTFRYEMDGTSREIRVTKDEADGIFGKDKRECWTSVKEYQER